MNNAWELVVAALGEIDEQLDLVIADDVASESLDERVSIFRKKTSSVVHGLSRDLRWSDHLTILQNHLGLRDAIETRLDQQDKFWVAFIEVDNFKQINDRYTYRNADLLLESIARTLKKKSEALSPPAQAFRQHGDEFFIVGEDMPKEDIKRHLEDIREAVKNISQPCYPTADLETSEQLMEHLQRTVDYAKRSKGMADAKVVSYEDLTEQKPEPVRERKRTCPDCKTTFYAECPVSDLLDQKLFCPNCSARIARSPRSDVEVTDTDNETMRCTVSIGWKMWGTDEP